MPTRVGKYEIVGEIGHGGMATVYRARDTLLSRPVALKIMHPHLQGAKEARTRFAREAMTVARLKHPSILEIYDYSGEDSDTSFIATELLTGPTLKQFVEQQPEIPPELAACIGVQLARALGAAHAEGVVHRDVKPENVLLHEGRAVKLTDFGIAQLVDMQSMTTTGQVLGSPAHMSPEQIEGKDCDARSDLFSLGTVLYLLTTGELPFQGRNPHQVLKQIMEGQFRDPLQLRPQIGGRMSAIIGKCLRVDPAERYASAGELEVELLAFCSEAGIADPGELLAEYLKDPVAFAPTFQKRIIEGQIALGERAYAAGDFARATDAWSRVLAYDENNAHVRAAVQRFGRRSRLRRAAWLAALALLATGLIAFSFLPRAPAPPSAAKSKPKPAKTVTSSQTATRPAPAKSTVPVPEAPARPQPRPAPARPERGPSNPNAPRHVVLRPEPANVAISIDGSLPRDFGPSFRELDLAPGMHTFSFVGAHDCCVDEEISVKIPAGPGVTVVAHKLKFRPAGLYVVTNTPANVVVDGGSASGRSRSIIQVPQPGGMFETHEVRISADGHRELVREVRLRAGQVETLQVVLPKDPG
jgi:eukaryotic-like serine/threonine-protein kinase